jgi:sigma-B regulation protein RsbU (phosphoserine phosphatase)
MTKEEALYSQPYSKKTLTFFQGSLSIVERDKEQILNELNQSHKGSKDKMAKILVVDDEQDLKTLMTQRFRSHLLNGTYDFIFAANKTEAIQKFEEEPEVDILLTDINLPDLGGLSLLEYVNEKQSDTVSVVISAYGDMNNLRNAMNRGAFDFVTKPVDFDDIERTLNRSINHLKMLRSALADRTRLIALNQELAVASHLQQAILPRKFPTVSTAQFHAIMQPATEVAGDFYDFFWIDADHLGLVIADVSGKGITASLFMAVARTHLKAIAPYCNGPADCLKKLNGELAQDNETAMFVTVFYGILNIKTGQLIYANGGHCPPVLKKQTSASMTPPQGVAVGVFEEAAFQEATHTFTRGETLFLYTDGVTEAMNPSSESYMIQRLLTRLDAQGPLRPTDMIADVLKDIKDFSQGAPQSDDITCLVLQWEGAS